jgi:dinuclear metal center YbgI/SA1388 family protein
MHNQSTIRKIAAAVDFSTRAVQGAIASGANLLVVHHGMYWGGLEPITGSHYRRVRMLIEADIAVYAAHLPLDRHPTLGNNALLAKELGLQPSAPFARFEDTFIGLRGESDIETAAIIQSARGFARTHGGDLRTSLVQADRRTRKWAICTGAGASADTLREISTTGVDTLIVGEGPHWTAIHAEENDLVIIYAGHYATETLGVCALAQHLSAKYDLPWSFVSAPTGL